jgi:O-antigen ligase
MDSMGKDEITTSNEARSMTLPTRMILVLSVLAAGIAAIAPPTFTFIVLGAGLVVALFALYPMLGLILIAATYPFIYLQVPISETMRVPIVDLLAMATALGVAVRLLALWIRTGERPTIKPIPGFWWFIAFLAAATLSLFSVSDLAAGVKFLFRPLTFFYFMFVAVPHIVIDTPRKLFVILRVLFVVGLAAAAMGAWSFVFPPEPGMFRRAVPMTILGIAPLGTNHNLIAEVLVSVIPIGLMLSLYAGGQMRRWYAVGVMFMISICMLTFSRNAWLSLAVEFAVVGSVFAHTHKISWRRIAQAVVPMLAVATIFITLVSQSSVAESSNRNRLHLTEIAFEQFRDHPIIGSGVGTFMEAVRRDRWYIADYGTAQEAHGVAQKLLAETGIFGFVTFFGLLAALLAFILRTYMESANLPRWRIAILALSCSALGSIIFQLFNTSYYVSKMWLPIGVALAASQLARRGGALKKVGY